MDNTDNPPNLDPERYASESQPPDSSPSHLESTQVSGIVEGMVDLREAVARLGEELTALSNELGENGSDFPGISPINPDLINEIGGFRLDVHNRVAQLSETARFWLEQDPGEMAFMPPEAPPGSPESNTSEELGGPSFVAPSHPLLVDAPRLLLGGSYHTPPLDELRQFELAEFLRAHNSERYNSMPQLMSSSESSDDDDDDDDDAIDLNDYRARFQAAGRPTRDPPEGPSNEDHGMPGLMSVSESSDDEGSPSEVSGHDETYPDSNDEAARDEEGEQEGNVRPALSLPYTRDPWVVPGSWTHQLLMQGQAPDDDSSPPSLITSEEGQLRQLLETRVPVEGFREPQHTGDAAWRIGRMQKLLSSLEVLDDSLLERFCRVGGGGGEHNDQCMICWESLKVEPMGDRSWTAIENALSDENGQASTSALNPNNTTSGTQPSPDSSTIPTDVSGAAALPCLHVFHSKCLVPWFDKLATTCPVCRFDLDPGKLLMFSASPLSNMRRLAGLPFPSGPSIRREVNPREDVIVPTRRILTHEGDRSSTASPMQGMDEYDDAFWSLAGDSTTSIPAPQDDRDISEDTSSEMSSGDGMPPLSEPLANGAGDLPAADPLTAQGVHTISPLSPASNQAASLSDPSAANHDNSDEEPLTTPPTHASDIPAREDTVIGEANIEERGRSVSDLSTDVDSMPSLIDTNELVPLPEITRSGSRGTPDNPRRDPWTGERSGDRSTNPQATSTTTDNPQQAAFRDFATETRTFLSELRDTVRNAYVRFSYIQAETTAGADVLRAQANRWESLTSNVDVDAAGVSSQSAFGGNATGFQGVVSNPPLLWLSSQDAARREWVLPKGPVEGGVADWVVKREAEIRGDLELRPR